ncbi:MAG: hypothetical protein ACHQ6U_10925 [Thermodesulfobacteriota bacterium]
MRESDSGSGCVCCSGGVGEHAKKEPSYHEIRESARDCGRLHREIRERYGEDEVEIIQIEPKDYIYVMPRVLREILKHGQPFIPSLRTLFLWYPVPTVIVNGRTVSPGNVPSIDEIQREIKGV